MSAQIIRFPASPPSVPLSKAEEFFWRQAVPYWEPDEALEQAYSLAAAEALALRAGVLYIWDWDEDPDLGDVRAVLETEIGNGFRATHYFDFEDSHNADRQRVFEAQVAREYAALILRVLDSGDLPDPPLAEWERELLLAA